MYTLPSGPLNSLGAVLPAAAGETSSTRPLPASGTPYFGLEWEQRFGRSAELARGAGEAPVEWSVLGVSHLVLIGLRYCVSSG